MRPHIGQVVKNSPLLALNWLLQLEQPVQFFTTGCRFGGAYTTGNTPYRSNIRELDIYLFTFRSIDIFFIGKTIDLSAWRGNPVVKPAPGTGGME
ncbi:MAG: hypothetical protein R2778_06525 [Saprospiraceae bacterium]